MWGVVPVENNIELGSPVRDVTTIPNDHSLKLGMVTCHSLTLLNSTVSGDPLDIKVGTLFFFLSLKFNTYIYLFM